MYSSLDQLLREYFDDNHLCKRKILQRLWSNYGEIARYFSPKLNRSIIVKHVKPPSEVLHPRGWHSDVSHQRKVTSYAVEANFYQSFASFCDEACYVPQFVGLIQSSEQGEQQTLIMEDLDTTGFNRVHHKINEIQIKAVLSWLAHFHGRFINTETPGLWPIGSYWHFATRQDEYQAMPKGMLKDKAKYIADTIEAARFRTLVHGDAKLANFCFSQSDAVAAVDFQYVGTGVGVKDVMYFLGSCLQDKQLWALHDQFIDYYFSVLKQVMSQYSQTEFEHLEQEWRALIPFVWADFHRFLLGWSAEHPKINDFMHTQTALALE